VKKRIYFVVSFIVETNNDSPMETVLDNIAENIEIDMVDTPEDPGQSINLSGAGIVLSKPRFEDVSDVNPM